MKRLVSICKELNSTENRHYRNIKTAREIFLINECIITKKTTNAEFLHDKRQYFLLIINVIQCSLLFDIQIAVYNERHFKQLPEIYFTYISAVNLKGKLRMFLNGYLFKCNV